MAAPSAKTGIASSLRRLGWRALRRVGRAVGFDVVWRHYYSPIPDVRRLPARLWAEPADMPGVEIDVDAQLDYIERELAPHVRELEDFLRDAPADGSGLRLDNPTFRSVDLELLYALVRRLRPPRVVELGSGFSSMTIERARAALAEEGHSLDHRVFDPYPWLSSLPEAILSRTPATDVPQSVFNELEDGDFLFVDTTHTVKVGSDVNHIVLQVLPTLSPGVVVHFHDIFLPWEYPRSFYEELEYYWGEQYLLRAFLAFNPGFEVLLAHHAIARSRPDRLARTVQSFNPDESPSSFWLRRVEAKAAL